MEKNDPKTIFGWCMYDWANSAYILTVVTAVLPVFFSDVVVPKEGFQIGSSVYSATSLWGFAISASALFVFLCAPLLGAIADFSAAKKKFLLGFCYTGSLFCILLVLCGSGDVWLTMILLAVAQIGFVGANIFYDAFLPHIATEDKLDWVSGKGYAFGYIGSDIQFLLCLALILSHESIGISGSTAVRIVLAFSGLWWAGFSLFTWRHLHEAPATEVIPETMRSMPTWWALVRIGFGRTTVILRKIRGYRHLVMFLLAFMLYNEGIQTVITMATIYGKDELGLPTSTLMITLFVIQLVAMAGALAFGRIAGKIGTRRALLITLAGWSGVVVYAYFMTGAIEYMVLGVVVGTVQGGSQALSRSYYASMIPPQMSAEFYGFYSVFTKFSAIWGPFVFAVIRQVTGTARLAIVSLMVFFVAGMILLSFVDERKAREARLA